MDVLDFGRSLPQGVPPQVVDNDRGISRVQSKNEYFIPPRLLHQPGPSAAQAILITAPAASGKSTCAREIAAQANALLVDLSGIQVADGTFNGLLVEALGDDKALQFRRQLLVGTHSIVIDALDETQLASGEDSFALFVKGLCRFLRLSEGKYGNVVLLGRIDASDWVKLVFAENGVSLVEYHLDFFDEEDGLRFVDRKLDGFYESRNRQAVHRRHPIVFAEAREKLLQKVGRVLGEDGYSRAWMSDSGKRFLGYAPVLEAFAAYLAVDDHQSLGTRVGDDLDDGSEWQLLASMATKLLRREQQKFIDSWMNSLRRPMFLDGQVQELYTPAEQCDRISSKHALKLSKVARFGAIDPSLHGEYQNAVQSALGNHPFLSGNAGFVNDIFEAYAYAQSYLDPAASRAPS